MNYLKVISVSLLILLLLVGLETIIKIKKSEGKMIDEIRDKLIIRINIIMVLTVFSAILTIVYIILNRK